MERAGGRRWRWRVPIADAVKAVLARAGLPAREVASARTGQTIRHRPFTWQLNHPGAAGSPASRSSPIFTAAMLRVNKGAAGGLSMRRCSSPIRRAPWWALGGLLPADAAAAEGFQPTSARRTPGQREYAAGLVPIGRERCMQRCFATARSSATGPILPRNLHRKAPDVNASNLAWLDAQLKAFAAVPS